MQQVYRNLKRDIKFLSHCLTFYHNKYRFKESILKERNKVYLLSRNTKITRLSKKWNHNKIKSFKIFRNIKRVSFKLDLFKEIKKKYLICYISLLKLALLEELLLWQVLNNYLIK